MIWEALGAAVLGLALAYAATSRLPARFPNRPLVLATGPGAALLGCLISRVVLGPGHSMATLTVAVGVSVAILSLLFGDNAAASRTAGGHRGHAGQHRRGRLGAEVPSPPRA